MRFRDRKFCLVLYPDDVTHAQCLEKLKAEGYEFACCLHDKDIYEDGEHVGEFKKPHYHVVLKFKNAIWNESLAKQLGIECNYIEQCRSLDGALLYLLHFGFDDKYQYNIDDVEGSLKNRLVTLLTDTDESTRALNLYDMIMNASGWVTYSEIFKKACLAGLYGDFRRMGAGVKWLIDEHNNSLVDDNESPVLVSSQAFNDYLNWVNNIRIANAMGEIKPLEDYEDK